MSRVKYFRKVIAREVFSYFDSKFQICNPLIYQKCSGAYGLMSKVQISNVKLPDLSFETGLSSEIAILTTLFQKTKMLIEF